MEGKRRTPQRRQARGEDRRRQIADAALRVIERDGLDGVTHRTVAAEAGVPLGATTYYFSSKEELMEAAMELLITREAETLEQLAERVERDGATVDDVLDGLLAFHSSVHEQRGAQIAQFELYLRMARSDREPPSWIDPYVRVARRIFEQLGSADPELDAQTAVALVNGLSLLRLTVPGDDYARSVVEPVVRAWARQAFGAAAGASE